MELVRKLNKNILLQTRCSEYSIYKLGCLPKCNENVSVLPAGVSGKLFTCSIHPSNHRLSGCCLPLHLDSVTECLCANCDSRYAFCHEALSGLYVAFRTILVLIWDCQPGFYRRWPADTKTQRTVCSPMVIMCTSRLDLNLFKPTGYVMYQQFNIQQLYTLPTLYLRVLYLSENKQRLVPLTT